MVQNFVTAALKNDEFLKQEQEMVDVLYSMLPGNAYASCNRVVRFLNATSLLLSHHWWHCLDQLIALFIHTTETDDHSCNKHPKNIVICMQAICYLFFLIFLMPFAILSFLIWFPLQYFRSRPFSYHSSGKITQTRNSAFNKMSTKWTYTMVTGNVCLMPEFLAKLNNVSNTVKRAKRMAQLLCGNIIDLTGFDSLDVTSDANKESNSISNDGALCEWGTLQKEDIVSENFPVNCDFLCLQEVFDRKAANALLRGLSSRYPYIIYDVAWPLQNARIKLLNSGLCIVSRFPFLNVDFKAFPDGYREDQLACKGLLMTKIYLRECDTGGCNVGYLATTHLQAITHSKASEVRCKQLNLIQDWLDEFKRSTHKQEDVILFDIICGDFNFDPESHFEENERKCDFTTIYRDPCLDESGQQHNWVIGTELKAAHVHDPAVNHAKGLQRMAVSESERPQYIASSLPANHDTSELPNGKRRIDYILYQNCGDKKMVIKDYKFITAFAALTDHIPVTMSFTTEDRRLEECS